MSTTINSMSDIGRALASKDGEFYLKQLNDLLDRESSAVDRKIRGGLDKDQYARAQQHLRAIASAKLIIKSIYLYHASQ
jgi:hypothetical protein